MINIIIIFGRQKTKTDSLLKQKLVCYRIHKEKSVLFFIQSIYVLFKAARYLFYQFDPLHKLSII